MGAEPARTVDPGSGFEHDMERLYRSWRILDLVGETAAQLPPEWLNILNVARTLMLGSPLPGVDLPDSLARMVQPDPEFSTVVRLERKRRVVYPLTGDTEIQPLRNVHDFANITAPDLLLRNLSRRLFEYRLISGNIHGVYNIDPGPVTEEWDEIVEERVPIESARRRRRQRIYVLFDVSNSMRDANKIIFAKALVLAYLVTASQERARVHFRTFANSVHRRTDCHSLEGFADVAQRVLRIEPDGSTDIRVALAAAIGDINALDGVGRERDAFERSPTELLLISDCESYFVPQIPRGVSLHTIHLKAGQMHRDYEEGFELIRASSTSFHEIDTTRFVLPETMRDRWLLQQDGRRWEPPAEAGGPQRASAERMERRNTLVDVYERMEGADDRRPRYRTAARRQGRGAVPHRQPLADLARLLWARIRALFRLPSNRPPVRAPAPAVSFGLQIRRRR